MINFINSNENILFLREGSQKHLNTKYLNGHTLNIDNLNIQPFEFISLLSEKLVILSKIEDRLYLINDIRENINNFILKSGDLSPFISFRLINSSYFSNAKNKYNVSKDWHIDSSVVTLVCTYSGKGTEWVSSDSVLQRDNKLIKPEFLKKESTIYKALPGDVLLIKGEMRKEEDQDTIKFLSKIGVYNKGFSYNEGNGLVHRGPGFSFGDNPRLLLTISSFKKKVS